MSYWLYQHLGNLAPPELAEERLLAEISAGDEDGGPRLREFAHAADRESAASRWAFHRDFGRSRLVVVDSRAARVLADGRRDMVDDEEWDWIVEHARGDYDHLIIASTLPVFMTPGDPRPRGVERGGLRGRLGRPRRPRRREAAARRSTSSTGRRSSARSGRWSSCCTSSPRDRIRRRRSRSSAATCTPPTSPRSHLGERQRSRVYQVVCSPFRNPLRAAGAPRHQALQHARRRDRQPAPRARCGRPAARRELAPRLARRSTTRSPCSSSTSGRRSSRSGAARPRTTRARRSRSSTSAISRRSGLRGDRRPGVHRHADLHGARAPPRCARSAPSCGRRRRSRTAPCGRA